MPSNCLPIALQIAVMLSVSFAQVFLCTSAFFALE